jgi:outer membrane receptor protein involved in Fe transport
MQNIHVPRVGPFRAFGLAAQLATILAAGLPAAHALAQDAGGQAATAPAPAAQAATESQLQEIVVTAQKRASTVDKTPISMTAVSGEDLQDRGIADFSALAAETPGVSMKTNGPGQTEFEMRGMTSSGGNSPTVGFYLDDVPLSPPASAQNGKVVIDPSLYDLNRVEVLRGPQGTLYGAGSMGGTVKLVTNQPDLTKFDGSAQGILSHTDGGGFNHGENAMLNVPLIKDELGLRIVASQAGTSGWIDRIVAGDFPTPTNGGNTRGDVLAAPVIADYKGSNYEDLKGARATLTWKPTQNLTITPSVFWQFIDQGGPSAFDNPPATQAHYQPFDIKEPYSDSVTINNLTVKYSLDSVDITSVTSNWHRVSRETQDGSENFENPLDGFGNTGTFYGANGTGPIFGLEVDPSNQISEELRASSNGDGRLQWVGGIFYSSFQSNWQLFTNVPNPSAFGVNINNVWTLDQPDKIKQHALFGEATYALTDKLKVTGGLRWYSYDNHLDMIVNGFGEPSGSNAEIYQHVVQSNSGVNPKVNLSYEATNDVLYYATAARGFRPGGGNQPLPTSGPVGPCILAGLQKEGYTNGAPNSYGPDSVWSYEAGEKAKFLDSHLRVNTSFFYENWRDIQLEELPCNYPLFDNANTAHIYGGELEIRAAVTQSLTIGASAGYTHATLAETTHGFHAGDKLPDVPPVTASVNLNYHTPLSDKLDLVARAENVYTGTRVDLTFPGGEPDTQSPLPSYDLTNARIGVAAENWTAYLFADNLFNKKAYLENITQITLANANFNRVATNQPLTIGVDLSYHF